MLWRYRPIDQAMVDIPLSNKQIFFQMRTGNFSSLMKLVIRFLVDVQIMDRITTRVQQPIKRVA